MGARGQPLTQTTPALAEVVERAYRVFKRPAPGTTTLGVCDCCMPSTLRTDFLRRGPTDLPAHYLREWFNASVDVDFGKPIMAWTLPRVLELAAAGTDLCALGYESAFGRMRLAGYPDDWSDAEREVVEDFFAALLDALVEGPDRRTWSLNELLHTAHRAGAELLPLLARLDALDDAALARALWTDWEWAEGHVPLVSIWEHSPQREQMQAWHASAALSDRMTRIACEGRGETAERAAAISDALFAARQAQGRGAAAPTV